MPFELRSNCIQRPLPPKFVGAIIYLFLCHFKSNKFGKVGTSSSPKQNDVKEICNTIYFQQCVMICLRPNTTIIMWKLNFS